VRMAAENFEFYFEGDAYFAALWRDLMAAQRLIWIEIYILSDDEIGGRLKEILIAKAQAGLDVRLICDALGSFDLPEQFLDELKKAGVRLRVYHPLRLFFTAWNLRDHRKTVVIDNEICYLGGFNFHRESAAIYSGPKAWRDTHVRFTGVLVEKVRHYGRRMWGEAKFMPRHLKRFSHINDVISNQNRLGLNHIKRFYHRYIRRAKKQILITTAYFNPDFRTIYLLLAALRRGVKIEIVTNGDEIDVPLIRRVNRAILRLLIRRGVAVYYFTRRVMHAKTAVFDDNIGTVGTANLNHRSFFLDLEINIFFREPKWVNILLAQHAQDLMESRRVTLEELTRLSWLDRLLDRLFYWIRGFF
jgi:cardiolipin synthase